MACSKFEYVKNFEQHTTLLRNTYVIIRIDGHCFHRFTTQHGFKKPNDKRCIDLMNSCAEAVMKEFQVPLAYGQSDEFSFFFPRDTTLYQRRESKLITNLCSLFTSCFVMNWPLFFTDPLQYPPTFDARAVLYPTTANIRDYFSWRQADCHVNNLYNTAFWALCLDSQSPKTEREAQEMLMVTDSGQKNELLFAKFGINYNNIEAVYRKGSVLVREPRERTETGKNGKQVSRSRLETSIHHLDIIGNQFWINHPQILQE